MSFHHRIRTIYRKELVDILRDRRTLIAMIVVPIVLYPLLMLGSVQAVSYQIEVLEEEKIFIGVVGEAQGGFLQQLIEADNQSLETTANAPAPDSAEPGEDEPPAPLRDFEIKSFESPEFLRTAVQQRRVHFGVIFDRDRMAEPIDQQTAVAFLSDSENMRSALAMHRVRGIVRRMADRISTGRLAARNLPREMVEPFVVTVTDLAAPTSILGQILPLILILLTITGAIYPAIYLTAGERERGTLESLMVCPVSVIDLIVGKFLVVTTVAIMGATLNLASVTATVYFGGFDRVLGGGGGGAGVPLGNMLLILACLIPFAVLMSAVMMAVCSYARTFKEAQNYVTPVIIAVLIPGGIAALPATQLDGVMLVMPVGNMVLLARDLLLVASVPLWQIIVVLLSTTLYAGAAIALAANVFGKESVVFADATSFKAMFSRVLIKPSSRPSISLGLMIVAILFPVWFFVQSALSPDPLEDARGLLRASGLLMPLLFVVVPVAILLHWKVNVPNSLSLRVPHIWHWVAGVLIGVSAWVPAHELNILQERLFGAPQALLKSFAALAETLAAMPVMEVVLLIAVVPAVCEELLFRGILLSGLGSASRKWTAIIGSAVVFAVFHFFFFKFAVTAALGIVLAYLCWQTRSILPGILAHFLHNYLGTLTVIAPEWPRRIGLAQSDDAAWTHLPPHILVIGGLLFIAGLFLAYRPADSPPSSPVPAVADG